MQYGIKKVKLLINMKKFVVFLSFLMSSNISCEEQCQTDKKAKEIFQNCILAIKNHYPLSGSKKSKYAYTSSEEFISILTGQGAGFIRIDDWDCISVDTVQLIKDVQRWEKWYKLNKCDLTMKFLNSVYHDYVVDTSDITIYYPTLEEFLENELCVKEEFIFEGIEESSKD